MHGIEDHIFLLQDIYHENKLQKKSAQKLDGPREIFFLRPRNYLSLRQFQVNWQ